MEKIDAVEMVRKIRDSQYEATQKCSHEELLKYYKEKGETALLELREMGKSQRSSAA
jgi:hypothetical protein